MSDIADVTGISEAINKKVSLAAIKKRRAHHYILLLPFFLLFIGDLQIPVTDSLVTVPMGMVLIFPVVFLYLIAGKFHFSRASRLLVGVLCCGFFGFLFTPAATLSRSIAGALPVVFAIFTILFYEKNIISRENAVRYMLAGGAVLALVVIVLFLFSLGVSEGYYDQKLVIETPLGRSNYLAAFLLFLFALSLRRSVPLSILFFAALFCTLSRGGVLALVLFCMALPFVKRGMLGIFSATLLFAILLLVYLSPRDLLSHLTQIFDLHASMLDSVFNRFELWKFGLEVWWNSPVFGIGPNTFRTFVELSGDIENVWGVHNSILLILLNYGIFGLLFYSAYLIVIYKKILLAENLDGKFLYLRVAFLILLIFGLYEPLIGSAAFEMLLAMLYVLAQSQLDKAVR